MNLINLKTRAEAEAKPFTFTQNNTDQTVDISSALTNPSQVQAVFLSIGLGFGTPINLSFRPTGTTPASVLLPLHLGLTSTTAILWVNHNEDAVEIDVKASSPANTFVIQVFGQINDIGGFVKDPDYTLLTPINDAHATQTVANIRPGDHGNIAAVVINHYQDAINDKAITVGYRGVGDLDSKVISVTVKAFARIVRVNRKNQFQFYRGTGAAGTDVGEGHQVGYILKDKGYIAQDSLANVISPAAPNNQFNDLIVTDQLANNAIQIFGWNYHNFTAGDTAAMLEGIRGKRFQHGYGNFIRTQRQISFCMADVDSAQTIQTQRKDSDMRVFFDGYTVPIDFPTFAPIHKIKKKVSDFTGTHKIRKKTAQFDASHKFKRKTGISSPTHNIRAKTSDFDATHKIKKKTGDVTPTHKFRKKT